MTLYNKAHLAYESLRANASTWRGMHVHAVLSLQEACILSMTEARMARWSPRLDSEATR